MIKHIVMWNLKDENKQENMQIIKSRLEGLVGVIPEIKKMEVGINFNRTNMAYDLCLYSEFLTKEDLDIYKNHPKHKEISEFVLSVRTGRVVCDYED